MPMRRFVPYSVLVTVVATVSLLSCKFSFADTKRAERGSITFGAAEKPEVTISPELAQFKTVFADIAEQVIPTVVSITSTKIDTVVYRNPFHQFFGSPFDDFFGNPNGRRQPPQQQQREYRRRGFGSGVVVSGKGHVLTNAHVVAEADELTVETADERKYDAEVVGIDSLSDVAVIKIKNPPDDLPVAYLGDSNKLRPGDWVMAVGNPFNLSSTVTTGIVSALGRSNLHNPEMYQNFIQTDAAINPGNSGGALVNIEGELIGINTMIFTRSGGYMGIGFAIPINMAKRIMEDLIYEGEVTRGWLGVGIQDVNEPAREAMGLGDRRGVMIREVFKGEPADKAGIKVGDVILAVDNKKVEDVNQLRNAVATLRPGQTASIKIFRKGKTRTLDVTIEKRNPEAVAKAGGSGGGGSDEGVESSEELGITVGPLTDDARQQLGLDDNASGVLVREIDENSQAARSGLREGDVITEVNQNAVKSVEDYRKAVKSAAQKRSVLLLINRGGNTFFIAYRLDK